MASSSLLGKNDADTIAVFALLVYGIVAACCSSPQTAEINAAKRSATLMKWVDLGLAQSAVFVIIGLRLAPKKWPVFAGAGLAAAMLYGSYRYALKAGLASSAPGTEN